MPIPRRLSIVDVVLRTVIVSSSSSSARGRAVFPICSSLLCDPGLKVAPA
jgi:hypothetical protein